MEDMEISSTINEKKKRASWNKPEKYMPCICAFHGMSTSNVHLRLVHFINCKFYINWKTCKEIWILPNEMHAETSTLSEMVSAIDNEMH